MKKLLALFILLLFSSISVSAMEKVKHEGSIMNEELKITDPDFYEISNHFIYEEAAKVGNLSVKEQELIRIVVLTVNQQPDSLKKCVKEALKNGVTPVEIKEAVYQTAPYAGISRAEIAVKAVNEVFKKEGIKLPVESQKTTSADNTTDINTLENKLARTEYDVYRLIDKIDSLTGDTIDKILVINTD